MPQALDFGNDLSRTSGPQTYYQTMLGYDWRLIESFMLVLLRTGTAVTMMPVFGYKGIPVQVKIGFAFVMSLLLAPSVQPSAVTAPSGLVALAVAGMSEVMVGAVIGLVTILVLYAAEFAGSILGVQIGFGMVNIIDPTFGQQVSIIGQLQYLVALIIFLSLDFHHHLLLAMAESFRVVPLGMAAFPEMIALSYARLSAQVFVVAVKLAAPVLSMILLTEVALAFMARMMPQMNVFIVGFPAKIGVGLLGLTLSWPLFLYVVTKFFHYLEDILAKMITMMG